MLHTSSNSFLAPPYEVGSSASFSKPPWTNRSNAAAVIVPAAEKSSFSFLAPSRNESSTNINNINTNNILLIGGRSRQEEFGEDQIFLLELNKKQWKSIKVNYPLDRLCGHTATLIENR